MSAAERTVYTEHTGRVDVPNEQAREAWLICGRRSGKSLVAAFIAVFLSCFRSYAEHCAPGEFVTVMIVAVDRKQARTVMSYIRGFLAIPLLSRMVANETQESITLTNRVRIEVHTASFRSLRGYTVAAAILDECAFFPTGDSAEPDYEIVAALRPAMSTIPNALLLGISSPYARRGILWDSYKEHYGRENAPALIWRAATKAMNPTVSQATIAIAYARDAAAAAAEYGAEFRTDLEKFVPVELVEAAMVHPRELPRVPFLDYHGFCDPSGGSSDSFTLAIAHCEREKVVLDVLRESVPPFSPEFVVREFAAVLRQYGVSEVVGDRYAGEFPRELFSKQGILYRVSERSASELYLELLPLLTSGRVEFFEHPRLKNQLVSLSRKTGRQRDIVTHPPSSHDDLANACAGAVVIAGELGGFDFALLRLQAEGEALQVLEETPRAVVTVFESKIPSEKIVGAPAPPPPREFDLSNACPFCKGALILPVVPSSSTVANATCSKCHSQIQVQLKNRFAPSIGMSRGAYLREKQAGQFGNGKAFGRFGR